MARKETGDRPGLPRREHFLALVSLGREHVDTRYSVSGFGWLGAFWLSLAFLGFSKHSFKEFKWQMCGAIGAAALFSAITFHLLRPNELQLVKLYYGNAELNGQTIDATLMPGKDERSGPRRFVLRDIHAELT